MAAHTRWQDIKRQRGSSPAIEAGYERARQAYQLGRRVRELREERGLSQTELARRMGTTQPMIARLEAGGVEPRLETLNRVCRALDLDLVVDLRPRLPAVSGDGS